MPEKLQNNSVVPETPTALNLFAFQSNHTHRNAYGGRGGVGLEHYRAPHHRIPFQGGSGIWSPGWAPPALLRGPLRRPSHTCSAQDYSGPPPRAPAPTRAAARIVSNQTAASVFVTAAPGASEARRRRLMNELT